MRNAVIPATGKISTGWNRVSPSSICIQRCWDQFPIQYAYGRDFQTLAAGLGILKAASNNSKLTILYESLILSPLLTGSHGLWESSVVKFHQFSRAKVLSNQMKIPNLWHPLQCRPGTAQVLDQRNPAVEPSAILGWKAEPTNTKPNKHSGGAGVKLPKWEGKNGKHRYKNMFRNKFGRPHLQFHNLEHLENIEDLICTHGTYLWTFFRHNQKHSCCQ